MAWIKNSGSLLMSTVFKLKILLWSNTKNAVLALWAIALHINCRLFWVTLAIIMYCKVRSLITVGGYIVSVCAGQVHVCWYRYTGRFQSRVAWHHSVESRYTAMSVGSSVTMCASWIWLVVLFWEMAIFFLLGRAGLVAHGLGMSWFGVGWFSAG